MPQEEWSMRLVVSLTFLSVLALMLAPNRASACGGCFAPTGQASAVTAHRMALAVSPTETTLWDQFEYQGNPDDFVWVLPVVAPDGVEVELADDVFFQALTQTTQVQLQGPTVGSSGGSGFGCGASGSAAPSSRGGTDSGVTIYQQATVGPYETVIIGSADGATLVSWLQDRGYAVPDAMLPTIQHYVDLAASFVVLRLSPDAGIQRMQPVRVTCPSASVMLPLQMIKAGVEGDVDLELFVFADQRMQAANFANAVVDQSRLTYDSNAGTFNYDALAAEALQLNDRNVWLTEYAQISPNLAGIPIYDEADYSAGASYPVSDYAKVLSIVTNPYLTRIRASLPVASLDRDLLLVPSPDGDLSNYLYTDRLALGDGATSDTRVATLPVPLSLLGLGAALAVGAYRRRRLF